MIPIDWLEQNAPGFRELSEDERTAITDFSFLWSLFEAKALNERGSTDAIVEATKRWTGKGLLPEDIFEPQVAYFRNRYFADGEFTYHFDHLHLRRNDAPDLVKEVLRNEDADPGEVTAALLIIVCRFRNNLFHGAKWSYELRGQLENFNHANMVLMKAIELHDNSDRGEPA